MNRKYLIILFFLCFNINLFPTSVPGVWVGLKNESEIDIMYTIRFNEILKNNKNADGINVAWASPINKDIIKRNNTLYIFSSRNNIYKDWGLMFNTVVIELNIYTIYGELILSIEDITDDVFYHERGISTIIINENTINNGKEKYKNEAIVDRNDFKLTYFDGIEFYDDDFIEWIGLSYLFSDGIWGIGLHSTDIRKIFFNYFHIGIGLLNIEYINNSKYNEYGLFLNPVVPNIGLQYSFNEHFKIAVSGLIKLGFGFFSDETWSFNYSPGFSVLVMFDYIGLKYTGNFNERYGYINQISISYTGWSESYRYKK